MPAVLFSRLEAEGLALYRPPHRRPATYAKVRKVLSEFAAMPGLRKTSDITPLLVLDWLDAYSHRAPMTNRSYLHAFRPICNYAKKMQYLKVTPFEVRKDFILFDFDEEDEEVAKARHLSLSEIGRYLDRLDSEAIEGGWHALRLQALAYTYLHTGLRHKEAIGLKVDDVHRSRGVIRIRSRKKRKLKTRTSVRLVGIPEELDVILERWIPETGSEWLFPGARRVGPWTGGSPGYKALDCIKALGERAGINDVTIHSFRRSLATHAQRLGINRDDAKDLLGHNSLQMQEDWYIEQDADNKRSIASRIKFARPARRSPLPADQAPMPLSIAN